MNNFSRLALPAALLSCAIAFPISANGEVHITVDAAKDVHPISPFIYGTNTGDVPGTIARSGGNRLTAYNWETNASNAGSDWHHQNDNLMSKSDAPGAAMKDFLDGAFAKHQAAIVTVPMAGYVAGDKLGNGDVAYPNGDTTKPQDPDYLKKRFKVTLPKKPGPLSLTPDVTDEFVYEDEFVNWVEKSARKSPDQVIFYDLDNEPDLWSETHKRIHPKPISYEELIQRTTDYSLAIKAVKPDAMIFGAVNYGWNGYRNLQHAPDMKKGDFQEVFLDEMNKAEKAHGRRLLDVLDMHFYSEAQGNGVRVVENNNTPPVVAARLQSPRSLWDESYVESSWITKSRNGTPLNMLPNLHKMIDKHYPGTKIALTEYNFGGGEHISGAIAEADVLGIFGQQEVFAANFWPLGGTKFIAAGVNLYINFDGKGASFGDTSVLAKSDDVEGTAAYASTDSKNPNRMVLVVLNRTAEAKPTTIAINSKQSLTAGTTYLIAGESPEIKRGVDVKISDGKLSYTMPAYSVTAIELK